MHKYQQDIIEHEHIKSRIREIFLFFVRPLNILEVFNNYDNNILTRQDKEYVQAFTANYGDYQGAVVLLDRLYIYKDWYKCLLKVLRDPKVKLNHVADMMKDALTSSSMEKTEQSCNGLNTYDKELKVIPSLKVEFGIVWIRKSMTVLQWKTFAASSTESLAEMSVSRVNINDVLCSVIRSLKMHYDMIEVETFGLEDLHVVMLIMKCGDLFCREEQNYVKFLKQMFGKDVLQKFGIIIMVQDDGLLIGDHDFSSHVISEKWKLQQTGTLQELFTECGGRCVMFQSERHKAGDGKNQANELLSIFQNLISDSHVNEGKSNKSKNDILSLKKQMKSIEHKKFNDDNSYKSVDNLRHDNGDFDEESGLVEKKGKLPSMMPSKHVRDKSQMDTIKSLDQKNYIKLTILYIIIMFLLVVVIFQSVNFSIQVEYGTHQHQSTLKILLVSGANHEQSQMWRAENKTE